MPAELPTCRWSSKAYAITDAREHRTPRASCCARRASSAARPPAPCWPRRCATAASRREPKRVVTFVCDSGNKYLSKVFNDYWMVDQGLTDRERHGDLRDLIARALHEGGDGHRRARRHAAAPPTSACAPPTSASCRCWTADGWSASSTRATCSAAVDGEHGRALRASRCQRHDRRARHTLQADAAAGRAAADLRARRGGDRRWRAASSSASITRIDLINHLRAAA